MSAKAQEAKPSPKKSNKNDAEAKKLKRIYQAFGMDDIDEDFIGQPPRRMTYNATPQNPRSPGPIERGDYFADNVSAYWDHEGCKVNFKKSGNDYIFELSQVTKEYFSLSWALTGDEIESLDPNLLLSISTHALVTTAEKPIVSDITGNLHHVKGNLQSTQEAKGEKYRDRFLVGFALNDGRDYPQAYRVWLDYIIMKPRSKSIVFRDLRLVIQDRLVL